MVHVCLSPIFLNIAASSCCKLERAKEKKKRGGGCGRNHHRVTKRETEKQVNTGEEFIEHNIRNIKDNHKFVIEYFFNIVWADDPYIRY